MVRLLLAVIVATASAPVAAEPVGADPVGWRHDEVGPGPIVVTWNVDGAEVAPVVAVWAQAVLPSPPRRRAIQARELPVPAAPPPVAILPLAPKTSPPR